MTPSTQSIIGRLRQEIKRQLSRCNPEATPHTCRESSTPEGYARIEAAIIAIVAREGVSIGTAIANIESDQA